MPELDDNGKRVERFALAARNLSRLGELTAEIAAIAESGAWRDYSDGLGHHRWLESELDYFLIACGLAFDDVSRVIAYNRQGALLAPMMNPTANSGRRRPLERASAEWPSVDSRSLADRAREQGWIRTDRAASRAMTPLRSAIPKRTRSRLGMTRPRKSEPPKIPAARRRELDEIAAAITEPQERRYLIDKLREKRTHAHS